MGTGGIEAADFQQAFAEELYRHQDLLLERFAEHEVRILGALTRVVGGPTMELRWAAGGPSMDIDAAFSARRWSSDGEGRFMRSPLSPKVLSEWPRVCQDSPVIHRLVLPKHSDSSLETTSTPQSGSAGSVVAPMDSPERQEDTDQQSPGRGPNGVGKRSSLEVPVQRTSTPNSLAESEHATVKIQSQSTFGSRLGSGLRTGMSYRMDSKGVTIDQSSRVATTLKELTGAEQDVHHQVSGLRRRNSVMSLMPVDGWEVLRRKAQGMLGNAYSEIVVAVLILLNAVTVGLQTNDAVRSPQTGTPVAFQTLELFFLGAFMVELTVRIVAEWAFFFSFLNVNFKWNMFDLAVVIAGTTDAIFMAIATDSHSVSAIRLLRILRLARVLRILRIVKFFSALRVMVTGILGSLKVLSFAVMLLTVIIYAFAVVILQFVAHEFKDSMQGRGTLRPDDYDALLRYFDSLPRTVFFLYASILGGLDWSDAAVPLMALNPLLGGLFVLYIAFAILCVLNIVTGVFVENANRITSQDEGRELLSQLASKKEWLNEAIKLFKAHDADGSGSIAWDEFKECAKDVKVQAWFRKVGVDVETEVMHSLWELLDFDGNGSVDVDEFVMALQQIHGQAKSIDMARVKYEVRQIRKKVDAFLERSEASTASKWMDGRRAQAHVPSYDGSPYERGGSSERAGARLAQVMCTTEDIEEIAIEPVVEALLPGSPEHMSAR